MMSPNPNENIPINLTAVSTICGYPVATLRKDMSSSEWVDYKDDWSVFNSIWAYNYTVSTLNGNSTTGAKRSPWVMLSNRQKMQYLRGQSAHVAVYPTAGSSGQFNNISSS
jgi:hypothetical protein